MDKSIEKETVKKAFVEALSGHGFETQKRESFLKWRDQDVYLVQKEGFSAVMFIKGLSEDGSSWGLNKGLFESFMELASDDEDTELILAFLYSPTEGFIVGARDFDGVKGGLKADEFGELDIPDDVIKDKFEGKRFTNIDELFTRLGTVKA